MGSTGIEPGGTQSHPVSHPLEQLFYPLSESFPSKSSASPQAHSMVVCPQQCLMHVQILGGTQLRPKLESWQPAPLASAARIWQTMCLLGQSLGCGGMTYGLGPLAFI